MKSIDRAFRRLIPLAAPIFPLILVGCSKPVNPSPLEPEHPHVAAHGGTVVTIGDRNHVEAVYDPSNRVLRVFVEGVQPELPFPVAAASLAATAPGASFALRAVPMNGESDALASRFVGAVPSALDEDTTTLAVSLPLPGGVRKAAFSLEESRILPTTARERALFLQPGGRYTAADIAANGGLTAAQRYRGAMARHNQNPQVGARICPISGTEANPDFHWMIGGKEYRFCCPPCIEEFVKQAKDRPESVRSPQDYVQVGAKVQ